jgi:uncharacterized protein (TIGR03790 family)
LARCSPSRRARSAVVLGALAVFAPLPARALNASQLGVIVNENDPASVEIASYYQAKRGIPPENILRVMAPIQARITRQQFADLKQRVDAQLPPNVQALAIAWTIPSRVECNSITSALARGFEAGPCETNTCQLGNPSAYFNSDSRQPYSDFGMRPTMMLAGWSVQDVKWLIDRGVASDGTNPTGTAAIMNGSSYRRSLRARLYRNGQGRVISPHVDVRIIHSDAISNSTDTLFYFTGSVAVANIESNAFPAGAVADNLTSAGGMLTDSGQMSVLEFVKGRNGATGTFGTVSEPCAWPSKFPDPAILIRRYTRGETLIEAYWKSVEQTFQGAFVGEPLARPWKR